VVKGDENKKKIPLNTLQRLRDQPQYRQIYRHQILLGLSKLVGHAARMIAVRNASKLLVRKPEGTGQSKDLNVDGRTLLKRIFGQYGVGVTLDTSGTGQEPAAGSY
jgi:hypothetical protein